MQSMNLSGVDVYGAPAQPVDDESILGKKVPLAFVPGKPPQKSARQDAVFESDYEPVYPRLGTEKRSKSVRYSHEVRSDRRFAGEANVDPLPSFSPSKQNHTNASFPGSRDSSDEGEY